MIDTLDAIAATLKEIALQVESESALIRQDHMARGELIEARTVTASKRREGSTSWKFNYDNLKPPVGQVDDVEYWGQRYHSETDFITGTSQYPWMPSTVSDDDDISF